jgi:hypothetical protein
MVGALSALFSSPETHRNSLILRDGFSGLHLARRLKRVHTSVNAARMSACATNWLKFPRPMNSQTSGEIPNWGMPNLNILSGAAFAGQPGGQPGDNAHQGFGGASGTSTSDGRNPLCFP